MHTTPRSSTRLVATLAALLSATALPCAKAQTSYYWDNNTTTAGFGTASGTWSSAASNFSTDSTGLTAPSGTQATAAGDTANFGTTTDGLAAGTVTVSGTVNVNALTFGSASGSITLSGGTIALGASSGTFTVNNASATIGSVITGTAGFSKEGTGTLIISGTPTASGGTVSINNGTIRLDGGAGGLGSPTSVAIASGASLVYNRTNSTSPAYAITGQGSVQVIQGMAYLKGSNTYSGDTTVNGGKLAIDVGTALQNSTLVLSGSAAANVVGFSSTAGTTITLGGLSAAGSGNGKDLALAQSTISTSSTGTLTPGSTAITLKVGNNNASTTYAGVLSGAGSLEKIGTGTLTLSGANTFKGNLTVTGGTLSLANTGSLLFTLGNAGVTNKVTGAGTASFDGTFKLNLSGVTDTSGSWNLVDVGTLSESFSGTFLVADNAGGITFTNNSGVWTSSDNLWSFSQATGLLTLSAVPEPSTYAVFAGLGILGFVVSRRRRA